MKVGLYNPYLDALGGGEKYFLTILEEAVRTPGLDVVVYSPQRPNVHAWERLNVSVPAAAFEWKQADDHTVTARSRELDLLVTMSNDVPVLNHARRAVAVVQFPTRARRAPRERARALLASLAGRRRAPAALASYDLFVCYSRFARAHIASRLGVDALVIAPPVDPPAAPSREKQRRILSVGRFFRGEHSKHQDVLIQAFVELRARLRGAAGWELHLVGGADESDDSTLSWLRELGELAVGQPVHFHLNASAAELGECYATSALFWHAAGYGERARRHPERLEHFGITTAEAMLLGAVPLVVPLGGQAEIVEDGCNGRHWRSVPELVERTQELIEDPKGCVRLRAAARKDARRYGRDRFVAAVREHVLQTAPER